MQAGAECENVPTNCTCGTECLPWLGTDDGTWNVTWSGSSLHCLHSPPLAEGQPCDYGRKVGPCQDGLMCNRETGKCEGTVSITSTSKFTLYKFIIEASPPGVECWSHSEGVLGQCTTGTECLPWLPDLGTWDGSSAKYCLHSPPLAEGDSCDYDQKLGPCGAGLFCDEGLCQGAKPS